MYIITIIIIIPTHYRLCIIVIVIIIIVIIIIRDTPPPDPTLRSLTGRSNPRAYTSTTSEKLTAEAEPEVHAGLTYFMSVMPTSPMWPSA